MMKKNNLLILAVAALGFAACANDETTAVNEKLAESNAISFRANVNGLMRGIDVNQTWLQNGSNGFKVRATLSSSGDQYFPETQYTYSAGTYTSTQKYYWPQTEALDFFAWAASGSDVAHTATYEFTVTPNTAAASQSDLVVACTKNKTKAGEYDPSDVYNSSAGSKTSKYGANGVPLNFRHAGTKVTITLTNGNTAGLDFDIRDASICNVKGSGVFTFDPTTATDNQTTTSNGGATLALSQWETSTVPTTTNYSQTITSLTTLAQDWILIPQTFTYATVYSGANVNDPFTGPCIKVSLKIKNPGSDIYIVGSASGENDGYVTAMWPLSAPAPASGWLPGKKYTYTVDLAGGGYYPANTAAGTGTALDPILDGAEIKFVTVTVDEWPAGDATGVYTGSTPSTPVVP